MTCSPNLAPGSLFRDGMAAGDPPHRRVEAEPVGIVHVVVAAEASENEPCLLLNVVFAFKILCVERILGNSADGHTRT